MLSFSQLQELKHYIAEHEKLEKQLRRLASNAVAAKKARLAHKQKVQDLVEKLPIAEQEKYPRLAFEHGAGRPCLEEYQPQLFDAIIRLAHHGSAADS